MKGKKKKEMLYLDTVSMAVKRIKMSARERIWRVSGYVLVALLFFCLALLFSFYFLESPMEAELKRELSSSEVQYKYLEKRVDQLTLVLEDVQQRDENLYRIIFEAEPSQNRKKLSNDYGRFSKHSLGKIIIETSRKTDELASAIYAQSKSLDEVYTMAMSKNERLECVPAIFPVNKRQGKLVSGFGPRFHPIFKNLRPHTGIDIAAARGVPVYSTGDGVIESAGSGIRELSGYGVCCMVNHGYGYKTLYAHLDRVAVQRGSKIKRGDLVGYVGSTGYSTGSHLHYEVILNGKRVNPVYYFFIDISPEEYLEILEKSKEVNQSLS